MLENLKVRTRLTLGFASVVALGIGIATAAAFQMTSLSRDVNLIAKDGMVKVGQLNEVKDNSNVIARAARNILISSDANFEAGENKKIADLRVKNTELLAALDKTITSPKARELFQLVQDARPAYNARLNEALAIEAKGDSEAAGKLLTGEVRELQNKLFKALDDSIDLQQDVAVKLAEQAEAQSDRAALLMISLALAMAAIGAGATWSLARGLSRALGAEPAELGAVAQRVAAGDLSPVHGADKARAGSVMASLADMQVNLARIVGQVRASSDSIATGSAQIATGNQDLSQRTEEQASNLQQTAASMEQISGTVKASADTADQANKLATSAAAAAVTGGEMVGGVVKTMQDIASASKKIADIIGVIDGIAFQTNILALNAAVEAARAGEQLRLLHKDDFLEHSIQKCSHNIHLI